MHALLTDVRYALRGFLRTPVFTAIAVLALALGMGMNTAIFSTINALLLKPLDYRDAERLVVIWDNRRSEGRVFNEVTPSNIAALRSSTLYDGIAVWDFAGWSLTGVNEPEQVSGFVVSYDLLPLLGVEPAAGRLFNATDDRPGAPPVALISAGLWQRRFQSNRAVIGQPLRLDGQQVVIAGVFPEGLNLAATADVMMPLAVPDSFWQARNAHSMRVIAKLPRDVSMAEARAELNTISARLEHDHPDTHTGWRMSIHPLNEGLQQGPVKPIFAVLFGAVGFVLLIACADVANLLLARAAPRRREVAIRTALGASRARLLRQLMTESALLAVMGAIAGLVIAVWVLDAIARATPATILQYAPRMAELSIDRTVLIYTLAICGLTTLLFGLVPAFRSSRADLSESLKERERGSNAGRNRSRLSGSLVVLQLALSLVLVIGAALMVQSSIRQQRANPGFASENLLTASIAPNAARYSTPEAVSAFQRQLLTAVRALGEVSDAATINALPLSGQAPAWEIGIPGRTFEPDQQPRAQARIISPTYPDVMGIQLLRGRRFSDADGAQAQPVALVSRSFATRYFPNIDAVGQQITVPQEDAPRLIVGVIADVNDWRLGLAPGTASGSFVYVPYQQRPRGLVNLVVRARSADAATFNAIRRVLFQADPEQPLFATGSMPEMVRLARFSQSIAATLLACLALVALLLAVCGVYGVMAYAVTQRTYEFGVRQALGASRTEVLRMVLRQGSAPVALGLVLGISAAALLTRSLGGLLFQVDPLDPLTFSAVAGLLFTVAILATALPALRALRVSPSSALRNN